LAELVKKEEAKAAVAPQETACHKGSEEHFDLKIVVAY
jgi:hypothetical protein